MEHFYVTVRDADQVGWLLGPYATHAEALDNVERGNKLSCAANDRAWFFAYGTCKVTSDNPPKIKTVFGL